MKKLFLIPLAAMCVISFTISVSADVIPAVADVKPHDQLSLKANELTVRVKSPLRCMFGDLDAVMQDQMHATEHNEIIMEIASSDGRYREFKQILPILWTKEINKQAKNTIELHSAFRTVVQQMNERGEFAKFNLPKTSAPMTYQIRICKNSDIKSRTCACLLYTSPSPRDS